MDDAAATKPLTIDEWLLSVLDQIVEHWAGTDLSSDPVARADVARARAGREIAEAHSEGVMWDGDGEYCPTCITLRAGQWPCSTIRWLAYGHRYDAAGYQEEWLPLDAGTEDRRLKREPTSPQKFDIMAFCPYRHPKMGWGCSETWGHRGDHKWER